MSLVIWEVVVPISNHPIINDHSPTDSHIVSLMVWSIINLANYPAN